ncbi:MAG: hypothetical protein K2X91_04110 [Thermoleophilia bacterium]|nr:hypothetical protein [Thermoleophilia bacterium]
MKAEEVYHRALTMCIDAYKDDRTPASWRAPAHLVPALRMAQDATGQYLAQPTEGGEWTFMGMPLEVLRGKPDAVLTLITAPPEGPAGRLPPVIRS